MMPAATDTSVAVARCAAVATALRRHRYRYVDERELHEGLAGALDRAGLAYEREVRLTPHDRIDFLCGDIGIEVKVRGGPSAVIAQLGRYAADARLAGLVLVTDRAQLARIQATVLRLKPVQIVSLHGGLR